MRSIGLAVLLATTLLAPAAHAQMAGPVFTIEAFPPEAPVEPGESFTLDLAVKRACPSQASVLEQQQVDLTLRVSGPANVSGSPQVTFPQQVCASQWVSVAVMTLAVTVAEDLDDSTLAFTATARPQPASLYMTPGSTAETSFVVAVGRSEPGAAAAEPVGQEAPSPAFAFVGLALLAAAVALRRRS